MPQWTKWDKSTIRTFVGQLSKNHRTKGLHGIISVHHTHIREQSTVECALTQSISTVSIFNRFFPLLFPLGDNKCLSFGSRFTEFGGFQLVSTLISPPKNHIIENVSAIDWNEWGEGICMSHHKSCIAGVITLRWSLHRIYASSPIFSHSIRFVFVAHFFVNQNFGLYTIRFKPTALFSSLPMNIDEVNLKYTNTHITMNRFMEPPCTLGTHTEIDLLIWLWNCDQPHLRCVI